MTKAFYENLEIRKSTRGEGSEACSEQSKTEGFFFKSYALLGVKRAKREEGK